MQYKIMYQPSYSLLELQLDPSESVVAESDAMVSMTPNVNMETGAKGGLFGALKRAVGGESMFQNTFTAQDGPGRVAFAPTMVGDIAAREMRGESLFVQSGSFLASSPSIELDTKWGGGPDVLLQRRAVRPQSHRCGHALHVQLRCHPCGHTCSRGAAGHGHWPYGCLRRDDGVPRPDGRRSEADTVLRRGSGRGSHRTGHDLYADAQLRSFREFPGPQAALQTRLIVPTR